VAHDREVLETVRLDAPRAFTSSVTVLSSVFRTFRISMRLGFVRVLQISACISKMDLSGRMVFHSILLSQIGNYCQGQNQQYAFTIAGRSGER